MNKNSWFLGFLVILALVVVIVAIVFPPGDGTIQKVVLPMPQGNIAAPSSFLKGYHQYRRQFDELQNIQTQLNNAIPKGYRFDESTESFEPLPKATSTPAPAPTVTPTPQPAAPAPGKDGKK